MNKFLFLLVSGVIFLSSHSGNAVSLDHPIVEIVSLEELSDLGVSFKFREDIACNLSSLMLTSEILVKRNRFFLSDVSLTFDQSEELFLMVPLKLYLSTDDKISLVQLCISKELTKVSYMLIEYKNGKLYDYIKVPLKLVTDNLKVSS